MEVLARPEGLPNCLLLRDSLLADANPRVVSTLLRTLLLDDTLAVLVVTTRYSTSHYSTMLRRLNLSVSKIAADGRFKVLNTNALSRLDEEADRYLVELKTLMEAVIGDITSLSGYSRRCAVLFDDVATLLGTCRAHPLTACRAIVGMSPELVACRILVMHEDLEDFSSALTALSHEAETVVTVRSLASGSSAEVEAQVEVLRRKFAGRGGGSCGEAEELGVVRGAVVR